jgi:hypothetical protein
MRIVTLAIEDEVLDKVRVFLDMIILQTTTPTTPAHKLRSGGAR